MNRAEKEKALTAVREAIQIVFGDWITSDPEEQKQIIAEATYIGEDDPGGWSPNAPVTVHLETGIPTPAYDYKLIDKWDEVNSLLQKKGFQLFAELINPAVTTFWPTGSMG